MLDVYLSYILYVCTTYTHIRIYAHHYVIRCFQKYNEGQPWNGDNSDILRTLVLWIEYSTSVQHIPDVYGVQSMIKETFLDHIFTFSPLHHLDQRIGNPI